MLSAHKRGYLAVPTWCGANPHTQPRMALKLRSEGGKETDSPECSKHREQVQTPKGEFEGQRACRLVIVIRWSIYLHSLGTLCEEDGIHHLI